MDDAAAARSRRQASLGLVILTLLCWAGLADYRLDDAFITFRHAANLADGHGFSYNPREPPVLATSTPGFTGLLAAAAAVGARDLPRVAWGIGLVAAAAAAVLAFRLFGRSLHPAAAFAGAALVAANPILARSAGLETSLYVAAILAFLLAVADDRPFLAGALLGGALWLRLDAVCLVVVPAVLWGPTAIGRSRLLRTLGVAALAYLPWVAYATAIFGQPWPHSLTAKRAAAELLPAVAGQDLFAAGVWRIPRQLVAEEPLLLALAPLILFGALQLRRHWWTTFGSPLRPLLGWAVVYFLAFEAVGLSWRHLWYWAPLQLVPAALAGYTLDGPLRARDVETTDRLRRLNLAKIAALALLVAATLVAGARTARRSPSLTLKATAYAELGRDLACGPDDSVAAWEVGILGWESGCPMLDLFGLVSPSVLTLGPEVAVGALRPTWTVDYPAPGYTVERTVTVAGPGGRGRVAVSLYRRQAEAERRGPPAPGPSAPRHEGHAIGSG